MATIVDGSRLTERIEAIRREHGAGLVILGHHYQRSAVLQHADEIGDSLELARASARRREASRIVFCGVRFMAETADILSADAQAVYMPEVLADCPMARMAGLAEVERAWRELTADGDDWLPVAYVNTTAEIKAFCGRNNGSCCTSGNADKVLRWAFAQGRRVFFLPDEHLACNTAHDLGLPDEAVAVYDPRREQGGLTRADLRAARVVAWKGFCVVHQAFLLDEVRKVREQWPQARIIVHPETPKEVVRAADAHGSTARIIRYVEEAPEGSVIVVGTELNLVQRLAERYRGRKTVKALAMSLCANMARTNEANLRDLLENWPEERRVRVPADVAEPARRALATMLEL